MVYMQTIRQYKLKYIKSVIFKFLISFRMKRFQWPKIINKQFMASSNMASSTPPNTLFTSRISTATLSKLHVELLLRQTHGS